MSTARELAEPNEILRCVVGSTVHGLQVEGQDDRDEMGICVEPIEHFFGMRKKFEQWVYRTKPEGVRSGPGDLDLTIYSLAKWARLAVRGNPTILTLLFVPAKHMIRYNTVGLELVEMRECFIGSNIFGPYLGYMRQQRRRLQNKTRMPNRPELVEAYGYDTKYAGHLLRLGYQGIELAETGQLTLPMQDGVREQILAVRQGEISEREVLAIAETLERRLVRLRDKAAGKPDQLDIERIERFVVQAYLERKAYLGRVM